MAPVIELHSLLFYAVGAAANTDGTGGCSEVTLPTPTLYRKHVAAEGEAGGSAHSQNCYIHKETPWTQCPILPPACRPGSAHPTQLDHARY